MSDLLNFVALSLLPHWCWLRTAERLRAGDPPDIILSDLLVDHWRDRPDRAAALRAQATAAWRRADEGQIDARRVERAPRIRLH